MTKNDQIGEKPPQNVVIFCHIHETADEHRRKPLSFQPIQRQKGKMNLAQNLRYEVKCDSVCIHIMIKKAASSILSGDGI